MRFTSSSPSPPPPFLHPKSRKQKQRRLACTVRYRPLRYCPSRPNAARAPLVLAKATWPYPRGRPESCHLGSLTPAILPHPLKNSRTSLSSQVQGIPSTFKIVYHRSGGGGRGGGGGSRVWKLGFHTCKFFFVRKDEYYRTQKFVDSRFVRLLILMRGEDTKYNYNAVRYERVLVQYCCIHLFSAAAVAAFVF